jgi:predicted O-linked N-acetylglucosamine transferase (SPINDLY family)
VTALAKDERSLQARLGLVNVLNTSTRFDEAEEACIRGLEIYPGHVTLTGDLSLARMMAGRAREAVAVLKEGLRRNPGERSLIAALPYAMNYAGDVDPREIFEAHAAYGRLVKENAPGNHLPPHVDLNPDRRLRLGVLSGDLRTHAVGFFAEPLLAGHDRAQFEITCYSTTSHEDATSKRLATYVSRWRNVSRESSFTLNAIVRRDEIDLLLEYSGLSAGHRLPMLHLRPAPVQMTYFGYPNTTGIEACDYRIVDSLTDPREPWYDALAVEKLWRLDPCFLCYSPPSGLPDPASAPSSRGQPFTFGSFNALSKLDDLTVSMLAGVLHAAPGAQLFMKYHGLNGASVRRSVLARFAAAGVGEDRLLLEGPEPNAAAMMPHYARMDVMLDSFPYHGTTTTCEALYMGVPVVTRAGRTCLSRVGVSILTNAGLPELIAEDEAGFIRIASGLAKNPSQLAAVRSGLRDRFVASPACDAKAYVGRMQGAFRQMWRVYCERAGR